MITSGKPTNSRRIQRKSCANDGKAAPKSKKNRGRIDQQERIIDEGRAKRGADGIGLDINDILSDEAIIDEALLLGAGPGRKLRGDHGVEGEGE